MELTFALILNTLGTISFALSGCLLAGEKKADIIGFWFLAIVASIGGGTIRDLLLGIAPVFWIVSPYSIVIGSLTAFVSYWFLRDGPRLRNLVLWSDAIGLGFFAILGASIALNQDVSWFIAILLGTITAVGGGILRDLLAGIPTLVMRRDIYASACVLGVGLYLILLHYGVVRELAGTIGVITIVLLRGLAIRFRLELAGYGEKKPLKRRDQD